MRTKSFQGQLFLQTFVIKVIIKYHYLYRSSSCTKVIQQKRKIHIILAKKYRHYIVDKKWTSVNTNVIERKTSYAEASSGVRKRDKIRGGRGEKRGQCNKKRRHCKKKKRGGHWQKCDLHSKFWEFL